MTGVEARATPATALQLLLVLSGSLVGIAATVAVSACAAANPALPLAAGFILSLPLAWLSRRSRLLAPSALNVGAVAVVACWFGWGAWDALGAPSVPHNIEEFRGLWRAILVLVGLVWAVLCGWCLSVLAQKVTSRARTS